MWDLDTLHAMNERAYVEYKRKQPTTTLEGLREKLRNARPPSISILLGVFQNVETYNDFVKLVREYFPEREKEILEKPTPHEQMACFASHFEDRYLPLHPSFRDEMCEDDYDELLRDIPVMVMGFGWDDYHELNNARLGAQLMSYLFESPLEGYDEGERVSLVDGFTPEYQREAQRVPANGITLDAAKRILKGKKWVGLRNWACYVYQDTGNWFLDTDDEMRSNMQTMEWDKETIEAMSKEWPQAQAFYDKMMEFAGWLEDVKEGLAHFKQTVDFILAHLEAGDVKEPAEVAPVACSRGLLRAPPARNNSEGET